MRSIRALRVVIGSNCSVSISNEALSTDQLVPLDWDGPVDTSVPDAPVFEEPAADAGQPAPMLRPPATGLAAALALGLVAAFFGWVSAAPFWLANGVGVSGPATVVRCEDHCTATLADADGEPRTVRLAGVDPSDRMPGTAVRARMLDGDDVAYAGSVAGLHLRWVLGFLLVVACGVGVAVATGVPRLRRETPRRTAILWAVSLGGPAILALLPVIAALG